MSRSQLLIRLPDDLKTALQQRASQEGKPLNQWIQDALIAALDSSDSISDSTPDSLGDSSLIAALISQEIAPLIARIEMLEK